MSAPTDTSHWLSWFRSHGAKLMLCARQWTRSTAEAEDAVQDGFLRYWRHQRELPGEPTGLVLTSIRRAALDARRQEQRRARREEFAAETDVTDTWFESNTLDAERQHELEKAIRSLPALQREVLVLKIWGERTFSEIANELDISANTAASRYRYALTALRQNLSTLESHG